MRRFFPLVLLLALLATGVALTSRAAPSGSQQTHLPIVLNPPTPVPPTATAVPTATPVAAPTDWLGRVNYYRSLGGLPPVAENGAWSQGAVLHSRYMVKNNVIVHAEDPSNPWYTPDGDAAGRNGNVMVSSSVSYPDSAAIDLWIVGPFHALGLLDPKLLSSAYGAYREADGGWQMGGTLDVLRGRGAVPAGVTFSIRWPQGTVRVPLAYTGGEWPDPLSSCAGYSTPTGLPLLIQLGTGSVTPSVSESTLLRDGQPIEHCRYDESSYTNPDGGAQSTGRSVLNMRDAVVILPRQPLVAGSSYQVWVTVNGQTHSWSFAIAGAAAVDRPDGVQEMR